VEQDTEPFGARWCGQGAKLVDMTRSAADAALALRSLPARLDRARLADRGDAADELRVSDQLVAREVEATCARLPAIVPVSPLSLAGLADAVDSMASQTWDRSDVGAIVDALIDRLAGAVRQAERAIEAQADSDN
jgi:hypothetical protein